MPGFLGWLESRAGRIPRVATRLSRADRIGACKARWGIKRMNFMVPPGLYAVGTPGPDDPVLVTANYQMSFDLVRRSLEGRSVWLLVLETYGINVWCAAGKGTFGTDELVGRVRRVRLDQVVQHRNLILPILGAPGVAAHEVAKQTGFSVRYATLRAEDIPEYLDNGCVATEKMRELSFTFYERLVLVPVEVVLALKTIFLCGVVLFGLAALAGGESAAWQTIWGYLGAVFAGVVLGPLLLPWLPGRSFAVKGAVIGFVYTLCWYLVAGGSAWSIPATGAAFLAFPAVSAFYTLNFTGCSTYTSRSGVRKEMRLSLPVMGGALLASLLLLVAGRVWS